MAHLAEVNGWSVGDAGLYLEAVFETWAARSRHQWTLDISLLSEDPTASWPELTRAAVSSLSAVLCCADHR